MSHTVIHEILEKASSGQELTYDEKKLLFKAMGENTDFAAELRRDFAYSRGEVLRPVLREQSLIRSIFKETQVDEDVPFPVRGEKVRSAWYTASLGGTSMRTMEEDEIYIPSFFIRGGVRWKRDLLRSGNVNLIEQLENDQVDSVVYLENFAGWKLIKAAHAAGDLLNIPHITGGDTFTLDVMIEIITRMDERGDDRRQITDIYLSPRRYHEILKWAKLDVQQLDDGTRREIFVGGPEAVANVLKSWNVAFHKVLNPRFVDDTKCYCFDARTFGIFKVDIPWETQEDILAAMSWEAGWIGREKVGFGILDVAAGCVYNFV